jgi:hypothetical protein
MELMVKNKLLIDEQLGFVNGKSWSIIHLLETMDLITQVLVTSTETEQ